MKTWNEIKVKISSLDIDQARDFGGEIAFSEMDSHLLLRCLVHLRSQNKVDVALVLVEAILSNPQRRGEERFAYIKGDLLLDKEDYKAAITLYSDIIESNPSDIAYNNRAFAFQKLGEDVNALTDYKAAVDLNPKNACALRGAGELLLKAGDLESSISFFNKALQLEPEKVDALVNRGIALYQAKDWVKCYESLQAALALDPQHKIARRGIEKLEKHFELNK